jgi:hypothetical protein
MRSSDENKALYILMRAHGVCPQCARPVLLSHPEDQNKAWGFGGCCKACSDGLRAALSMYVKEKTEHEK